MKSTNNPKIKSYYSIIIHSPDSIELRAGVWNPVSHYLEDDKKTGVLAELVKALDGTRSGGEIAKECGVKRNEVETLIDHLNSLGALDFGPAHIFDYYIDEVAPSLKSSATAIDLEPSQPILLLGDPHLCKMVDNLIHDSFDGRVQNTRILEESAYLPSLMESEDWLYDPLALEEKLEAFSAWKNHFVILAVRHINPNLASRLNRILYNLKISWLHMAVDGPFLFVGPLFAGGFGPCYDCFEKRCNMNLRDHHSYQKYKAALMKNQVFTPSFKSYEKILMQLISAHGVMAAMNFLLTGSSFIKNKVLSIYLPSMEISFVDVLRLSNCVTCGSVTKRDEHQLYFDSEALIQMETV